MANRSSDSGGTEAATRVFRSLPSPASLGTQFLAIGSLAWIAWVAFPTLGVRADIVAGALTYLAICCAARAIWCRDHTAGINAYRAGDFAAAARAWRAQRAAFSTYPVLDRFRYLLFATGSRTPYRTLAIANAGWAELKLRNLGEARRCFETALSEVPGDRNSRRGLANVIAREKLYEEGEG